MVKLYHIAETDTITIRKLHKEPLCTGPELKLLLDLLPDYSSLKLALGLIAVCGLRPAECVNLTWQRFSLDSNNNVVKVKHLVYKPRNTMHKDGTYGWLFKEIEKHVHDWSPWLSKQIVGYAKTHPPYGNNKVFPWSSNDVIEKFFIQIRKKVTNGQLGPEYLFLLDEVVECITDRGKEWRRVTAYSLRRFAFTLSHYVKFHQDLNETSHYFGHESIKTTAAHYVKAASMIGLSLAHIDQEIPFDAFVQPAPCTRILEPLPDWVMRFTRHLHPLKLDEWQGLEKTITLLTQ